MTIKERAKKLKQDIPAVFLALRNRRTPWYAKVCAALTVGYALSPIDLIPDFIPVLGYLDDLLILPFLVGLVIRLIPPQLLQECRQQAQGLWADGRPRRWYYALPILVIWGVILWAVIAALCR